MINDRTKTRVMSWRVTPKEDADCLRAAQQLGALRGESVSVSEFAREAVQQYAALVGATYQEQEK